MVKQYYFENEDAEICYTEEHFQHEMRINEVTEVQVLKAEKSNDSDYFWCSYLGVAGERGDCGKKQCETYKPRNSVKGACVHLGKLYYHGEEVILSL